MQKFFLLCCITISDSNFITNADKDSLLLIAQRDWIDEAICLKKYIFVMLWRCFSYISLAKNLYCTVTSSLDFSGFSSAVVVLLGLETVSDPLTPICGGSSLAAAPEVKGFFSSLSSSKGTSSSASERHKI